MQPSWSTPLASPPEPFVSPILDDEHVYVLLGDSLAAHRLADGAEAWRVSWPSGYRSGWAFADVAGVLLAEVQRGRSGASELVAHNRRGARLFQHTVADFHYSSCAVLGSTFCFVRADGQRRLELLDCASGRLVQRGPMPDYGHIAPVGDELWLFADERTHRFDPRSGWREGIEVSKVCRLAPHGDGWLVLRQIEGDHYGVGLHDGERFRWEQSTRLRFVRIGELLVRSIPGAVAACSIETGEPRWQVAVPDQRRLAACGDAVLVGLDDKTIVLDARDGARRAVLPARIHCSAITPTRLVIAEREALSAWPTRFESAAPVRAGELGAALAEILAKGPEEDVVPAIVALGLDLLGTEERAFAIRHALGSSSWHGTRVAEEALGDRREPALLRAAIEACPSNFWGFQADLADAAREVAPAALWPPLLARTARYAWEARGRIADAPEAALCDPAGFAALVEAAAVQRVMIAFLDRAEQAQRAGTLEPTVVRGAAGAIEAALAIYPSGSEVAERLRALAASVGLSLTPPPRAARLHDRPVPATADLERKRWEQELTGAYHYALFDAIGHPVPSYYLPFKPAVALKELTVVVPDPRPVRHGSWLVALELVAEGMLAVDEALAAASIPRPPPNTDPFGLRGRRAIDTPASKRFEAVATTLGPVLAESCPTLRERTEEVLADITAPGPLADREVLREGVLMALALGAAFHHAVYRVRVAPFEALVDALEGGGAYRLPKRPSLAALKKAHPAVPYWPLHATEGPPRSAVESCVARTAGARCPALTPDETPVDAAGQPLDFVFQLALGGLRGLPAGFAHGVALIAVFTGAQSAVVPLDATAVKERARRAVPPGVVALAVGGKAKEPESAEWLLRVDPERFAGRQSPHDVETLLGAYAEATREAHHTSSKIGGTYTPVQPFAISLPSSGADHLVAQLDFDDGAPLPDAGLLYVIATSDGGYVVTGEHT